MNSGDIVIVALQGDAGKPRPALVVSIRTLPLNTVILCPITSHVIAGHEGLRISIAPEPGTGLTLPSQISLDRVTYTRPTKIGQIVGRAPPSVINRVSVALSVLLQQS